MNNLLGNLSVTSIFVYPVKSCARIEPHEAKVIDTGFDHDREFMVVNSDGWFITQRQYPHMATIRAEIRGNELHLRAPDIGGISPLIVPIQSGAERSVTVWTSKVQGHDQGDEAAAWFGALLGRECRLVRKTPNMRKISSHYQVTGKELTSFADGYPFLLVSQASLDDLNTHLPEGKNIPMTRFRPNIVVAGGEAFQEDTWKRVKIGEVTFRIVKPCSRCEMINIDQDSGERDGDFLPLDSLGDYRRKAKGIIFGQNLVHENKGTIRSGDAIEVLEYN